MKEMIKKLKEWKTLKGWQKVILIIMMVLGMLVTMWGCGAIRLQGTSNTNYEYYRKGNKGEEINGMENESNIRRPDDGGDTEYTVLQTRRVRINNKITSSN